MKYLLYSTLGLVFLGLLSINAFADEGQQGGMKLLPGYRYQPIQGIDSIVAEISKPNGLRIGYEKGLVYKPGEPRTGGAFTDRPLQLKNSDQIRWYREQIVSGQPVHLAYRKDDWLLVSIPQEGVNFAVAVHDASEMAEALLMLLTYPSEGTKKVDANTADGPAGIADPAGVSGTIEAGSYLAIESLVVIGGERRITAWEVLQVDADFKVDLSKEPTPTAGEPLVKYCQEQIQKFLQTGELVGNSVLSPLETTEAGDGYQKTVKATYLFEGQWVQEGRVQRYVPSGQFRIELAKSANFKFRKAVSWNPEQ